MCWRECISRIIESVECISTAGARDRSLHQDCVPLACSATSGRVICLCLGSPCPAKFACADAGHSARGVWSASSESREGEPPPSGWHLLHSASCSADSIARCAACSSLSRARGSASSVVASERRLRYSCCARLSRSVASPPLARSAGLAAAAAAAAAGAAAGDAARSRAPFAITERKSARGSPFSRRGVGAAPRPAAVPKSRSTWRGSAAVVRPGSPI